MNRSTTARVIKINWTTGSIFVQDIYNDNRLGVIENNNPIDGENIMKLHNNMVLEVIVSDINNMMIVHTAKIPEKTLTTYKNTLKYKIYQLVKFFKYWKK